MPSIPQRSVRTFVIQNTHLGYSLLQFTVHSVAYTKHVADATLVYEVGLRRGLRAGAGGWAHSSLLIKMCSFQSPGGLKIFDI